MITFKCDLCGGAAVVRSHRTELPDFVYNNSLTLPEIVYEGVYIAFITRKVRSDVKPEAALTRYMKRDDDIADLCRECLLRALERGREVTREELEAAAVTS